MSPRFTSLNIERFRLFRELKIEGLGRVNLITGKNNTGKSSVLEALRLLASLADLSEMLDILRSREEVAPRREDRNESAGRNGDEFWLSSMFHDFPQFSTTFPSLSVSGSGEQGDRKLLIRPCWVREVAGTSGMSRFEEVDHVADGRDPALQAGLTIEGLKWTEVFPLDYRKGTTLRWRFGFKGVADAMPIPHLFVGTCSGEGTSGLGPLWDAVALSDDESEVIEALRILEPEIQKVSMAGGEASRDRYAIVRTSRFPRPVPLRSFGDGLNRLFGIALSLVNAKGGLLLIDEFENGMHYSVQFDTWRAIFRLARSLDVQVFATSHSWDAIEAFQQAAAESPEDGALIRLTRRGEDVIATVFNEKELAVVTRQRMEVR